MKRKLKRRKSIGAFSRRVAELRVRKAMTQEQLADALGVDKTAVSHWENSALPDIARLPAIAEALGVTVSELIEGEKAFAALGQMIESKAS